MLRVSTWRLLVTVTLFFIANLLFCLAYIVRDMAYLRAITIVAATCTLPYFYAQATPLYSAMGWQAAFIIINAFNLTILLLQRRPVRLNDEQQWLHRTTLRLLTPRKMLRFLRLANTHHAQKGDTLIQEGEQLDALILIMTGNATVAIGEQQRATLYPGDLAGEMSFISGRPASANVIAQEPVRYFRWSSAALRHLYQRDPEIKDALQGTIGVDMANKLAR